MIHEYALLTVAPETAADFEATFEAATGILLSASGCLGVDIQRSEDRAGVYLLKVSWGRIEDHLEVFAASPAAARLAEGFGSYFTAGPIVAHFAR